MSTFSDGVLSILDWLTENVMLPLFLVGLVLLIVAAPFLIYHGIQQSKSPTFELYKNQWACTNTQRIPITTYVKSGDVMIPVTTYHDECHQWNRQP